MVENILRAPPTSCCCIPNMQGICPPYSVARPIKSAVDAMVERRMRFRIAPNMDEYNIVLTPDDLVTNNHTRRSSHWIEFNDIFKFSRNFVNGIIHEGVREYQNQICRSNSARLTPSLIILPEEKTDEDFPIVVWPSVEEFNVELGKSKIAEYIDIQWYYEEAWLCYVDYLLNQSDQISDYFLYEAKFSIPTKSYPIAQATASVYFTIEVSRIQPPNSKVQVKYVFEGNRFKHDVNGIEFQEKWLFDIVDAKLKLFQTITF